MNRAMKAKNGKKAKSAKGANSYPKQVLVKQMSGYKNVYIIGHYKPVKHLCRYVPFMRLRKDVDAQTLTFVSPKCWTDPFENLYWGRDYDGYNKPSITCLCVTEYDNHHSEDAMWKSFSDSYDKTIRVVYNSDELFRQLDKFAEEHSCKIYVSKMDYLYTRASLIKLKPLRDYHVVHMDDATLITLMSLKRKAFEYENEVRIFVVGCPTNEYNLLRVGGVQYDNGLIYMMTIAPIKPFAYNDPRQQSYSKYQKLEYGIYRDELKKLIPSVSVSRSLVYQFRESEIMENGDINKIL